MRIDVAGVYAPTGRYQVTVNPASTFASNTHTFVPIDVAWGAEVAAGGRPASIPFEFGAMLRMTHWQEPDSFYASLSSPVSQRGHRSTDIAATVAYVASTGRGEVVLRLALGMGRSRLTAFESANSATGATGIYGSASVLFRLLSGSRAGLVMGVGCDLRGGHFWASDGFGSRDRVTLTSVSPALRFGATFR